MKQHHSPRMMTQVIVNGHALTYLIKFAKNETVRDATPFMVNIAIEKGEDLVNALFKISIRHLSVDEARRKIAIAITHLRNYFTKEIPEINLLWDNPVFATQPQTYVLSVIPLVALN